MSDTPPTRRVLRLITRLNIGGPARQALLLTRDLAPAFDTTLAAGQSTTVEGELSDPQVPVRRVPLVRPLQPVTDLRALGVVRRLLQETGADIMHSHMAKAGTVGRLAALSMGTRPRTVHTFHGHVLEGYFGPAAQRSFIEIERYLARHTDALVTISPQIRDALLDLGIGRGRTFHVIPLGFDLGPFLAVGEPVGELRRALGLRPETPLVGAVGRLVAIKDLETLLSAVELVPGAHLVFVGDGELRGSLEHRARTLGLNDRVHFTGWWHDVPGALGDIDVVALTSRNEGTPVALIEAAAAGRPVVATRVGGVERVVEDGVTGHLAAPGDAVAIADRISCLLGDRDRRRTMGGAGRRLARERFGQERLLTDVAALYSDLLGRRAVS